MIHIIDLMNYCFLLISLKNIVVFCDYNGSILHVMMTWHAIWQQGAINFHDNS
jgi:hypothetical protein